MKVTCVAVMAVMGSGFAAPAAVSGQAPNREAQIAAASLAAPANRREQATVMGYDGSGQLTTLRRGTNDLICMADDPAREGFETACYHNSLEPFMARGRELTAQGINGAERTQTRYAEVEAGTLKMPEQPAMLYILTGTAFDAATGVVAGEYRRSVIYTPFATEASTGLSSQGSETDPWIMFPGTAGAHIMITPPRKAAGG